MISLNRTKQTNLNKGFTIVELLIVIVVIGILALLVITTYAGIQQKTRNTQRSSDIKSIFTQLEAYYSEHQHYPSRTDMNDDDWLDDEMRGLEKDALVDPSNATQSNDLAAAPAAKVYSYAVANEAGTSCEADAETCSEYVLTATYEGDVNGATTVTKKNADGS